MERCERKGVTCNLLPGQCDTTTCAWNLPDIADKEIVITAEELEKMTQEPKEVKEARTFQELLTDLADRGTKLIQDYYTVAQTCDEQQNELARLRGELAATRSFLEDFEHGKICSPVTEDEICTLKAKLDMYEKEPENLYRKGSIETADKIIDYLSGLLKKPSSKKVAIDKTIKWIKNNFEV